MISDISLLIIALCMVILLIFVLVLLTALIKLIRSLSKTADKIDNKIEPLLTEVTRTLSNVSEITVKVNDKLDAFDPLFNSISKIGLVTESILSKFSEHRQTHKIFEFGEDVKHKSTLNEWAEWAGLGLLLWQKIKARMDK